MPLGLRHLLAAAFCFVCWCANARISVVMVSIDGLKPDYVLEADRHGLKIPHLRKMVETGSFARAVTGVMPTLTYPSHATLVTGVSPAEHGIHSNVPFDALGKNLGGWYWYAADFKVPTLWDAVRKAGRAAAAVAWPTTIGAELTYVIPQHWSADHVTPDDAKLTRALSTPGLIDELESELGFSYPAGYAYTIEDDAKRTELSAHLIEKRKPSLLLAYLSSLDEEQHAVGPDHPKVYAILERIDALVGRLHTTVESAYGDDRVFVVVSDHGFAKVTKEIRVNAALAREGLIKTDSKGRIVEWSAFAWGANGVRAVRLKDPKSKALEKQVSGVLHALAKDPANGIREVWDKTKLRESGGFPDDSFALIANPPYSFASGVALPVVVSKPARGEHGYLASLPAMDAAFFITGATIPKRKDLGRIDMRDVAPTVAKLLQVLLPRASGNVLLAE